ncbi:protein arginine N-methyltransferase, putative [Entamoeba dispar SAW760]|uniref:type I protein arginine methyltransferase n=1 Tax=Entamoeba dispar (strain ATCC PRA-260 / SAW760) TaxID=370354 RepID=B0EDK4_ENTDS|nr:protein arginine N-methyltransferase, putative [Entamoeba dispar SAW760]EDR27402.1 protein arginine N-methyltransferase, putative [Entamoeba dispar SAW760]|eukprot:EDR27402.1 protein arginine N-methyltransferase, putative [Entamoeba dispar SAW760]
MSMEQLIVSCDSKYYWNSYAHVNIHEEMIQDEHRTQTYKKAIECFCRGKIVVDVGCGTGILSLFAATAGAKRVYAIDMSDIAHYARYIVEQNGFKDVITVIKEQVEKVFLAEKVDVIVSEWMGYNLLFEGMLASVITARRFLKPNGIILPNQCRLFITAIQGDDEFILRKKSFIEIYGNLNIIDDVCIVEPSIQNISPSRVVSTHCIIADFNMLTMKVNDVNFTSPFTIEIIQNTQVCGFCCYFDCLFYGKAHLTTKPGQPTHWKQTLFFLKTPLKCKLGDQIKGLYTCHANSKNPRNLDIIIQFSHINQCYKIEYHLN